MVSEKEIVEQLKKLGFKYNGWGRGEAHELQNIILPDEKIFEAVNGIYEGGFALLVATDVRVLLVDKKPLNYLTVEDMRFDMISEMDYSHRLLGARISISSGDKNLKFLSYNQPRLRKLIGHVQHSMAESKRKQSSHGENQSKHLEKINKQLQAYLVAQQKQLEDMHNAFKTNGNTATAAEPPMLKPDPSLSDYLYAQSLLASYQQQTGHTFPAVVDQNGQVFRPVNYVQPQKDDTGQPDLTSTPAAVTTQPGPTEIDVDAQTRDIYNQAKQELFQKYEKAHDHDETTSPSEAKSQGSKHGPFEINPIRVAYSKLPMALRNRKFGRPYFHSHSSSTVDQSAATAAKV